ncbi:pyridoxamine 5'-phosphate oxidase family protein [Streptomyces sp. NPDC059909]|uniref:pyridoxamine 5'-phosphate oxidase family protein n=1 Tax=Streptomyces sp. NPDC059909 TaxID=3346998 RepID=UPI00364FA889
MDDGDVVIRTHEGSMLLGSAIESEVVAYEADELDPATRTGWSVIVTGVATRVSDQTDIARYQNMLIPWVDMEMGHVVRIRAEIVTGFRLERPAAS